MTATFERVIVSKEALRERMVDAYRVAGAFIAEGKRVHIIVKEALDPISARQRKFLKDIVFGQISEQVALPPDGARFTKDVWAEHFRKEWLGSRYEMRRLPGAKKATPHRIRNSTEEMGVKAYSEYTDRVIAHATTEYGVQFHFTVDEREEVRYRPRSNRSEAT